MRAVVTRVLSASVAMRDGARAGETRAIGPGLLILLGVAPGDDEASAKKLADKILALRVFSNAEGKFDKSVTDLKGELLVVSQFTLFAELKGGRRPDFGGAARPELAAPLCAKFAELLGAGGLVVRTGEFGASMAVQSVNDGPVTIVADTAAF